MINVYRSIGSDTKVTKVSIVIRDLKNYKLHRYPVLSSNECSACVPWSWSCHVPSLWEGGKIKKQLTCETVDYGCLFIVANVLSNRMSPKWLRHYNLSLSNLAYVTVACTGDDGRRPQYHLFSGTRRTKLLGSSSSNM